MITNVLVPLDGTLLAEQAVPTASSIVRRRHGHLELMFVRQARHRGGLEDWPWAIPNPEIGDEYLADQARHWSAVVGSVVGYATSAGNVAGEICRRAKDVGADLIVMATHGRTGLARAFGGSVADSVIRHTTTPVLLLRPSSNERRLQRAALRFQRILIAVDGSATSQRSFAGIATVAEPGVSEILLLRVVEPIRASHAVSFGYVAGGMDREATRCLVAAAERETEAAAEELAQRLSCDVFPHVVIDDEPAHGIVRFAQRYNVSLVAMTTHGRGASRFVLGSATESVLRDAHFPMLIVRPPRTAERHD